MKKRIFDNEARLTILNEILAHFQQIIQWDSFKYDSKDNVVEYQFKADAFIELLEVDDCGSVGGFDLTNKVKNETNNNNFNRFLALIRKYNKIRDLDEQYITIEKCIEYFK